jgi:hypothetical protein
MQIAWGNKFTLFRTSQFSCHDARIMKYSKQFWADLKNRQAAEQIDSLQQHSEKLELLRRLYPELNNDQLLEVKERLDGYFEVVLEVFLAKSSQNSIDGSVEPS